jgi:transcription elongation factor Elf1
LSRKRATAVPENTVALPKYLLSQRQELRGRKEKMMNQRFECDVCGRELSVVKRAQAYCVSPCSACLEDAKHNNFVAGRRLGEASAQHAYDEGYKAGLEKGEASAQEKAYSDGYSAGLCDGPDLF